MLLIFGLPKRQRKKVWPTSSSAHRSVLGASPLYPGVLQAAVRPPEYSSPEDRTGCRAGWQKGHSHIFTQGKISRAADMESDNG